MRRRLTIAALVTLVVALPAVTAGVWWWRHTQRTDLELAASYAPADAQRLSWTDWAGVRDAVGARLDASSSREQVQGFLDDGYDRDLTSASALVQSAPVLQARFGFSPATADWELFAQSEAGAVVIVRMPDDTDFDELADQLEGTGFTRPDDEDGVWLGGDRLLPSLGADLTPELQYVALDAGRHLVLTSDTSDYLEQAVSDLGSGDLPQGLSDVVAASGDPLSAAVYDGPYTCSALAMSQADASDAEQGDQLVDDAGGVDPLTGFAMSVQPGGGVRVAMAFENDDQARHNADSRSTLASGPAPGQGGDFTDRFSVESATAEGRVVRLELDPRPGTYVLSDLSTGPVLFATC
ncbi:hypothetical protein [Nocardioides sp. T2.26MG-1]|uniref:hypothetical protein n=1 Tax=Nocardioides sp. T2.26MG-1 TaxID=3041166 RepID=UPI0024773CE3|nr:hypothetical protein [Nocardioides sp. T2.26MG-1]CAI9412812.1 hypothetical protein HIDPHFAB_01868 [Nocardioides sp. T2.26MG-1]